MSAWMKISLTIGLMVAVALIWKVFSAFPIKSSADAAAWLQAIGSVAAIVAVFVLQRRDHFKAEARDRAGREAEERDELETLMLFLVPLHISLKKADGFSRQRKWDGLTITSVSQDATNLLAMLGNIRAAKLPSRRAAISLMAGQRAANEAIARLEHIKNNHQKVPAADAFQDLVEMLDLEMDYLEDVVADKR